MNINRLNIGEEVRKKVDENGLSRFSVFPQKKVTVLSSD